MKTKINKAQRNEIKRLAPAVGAEIEALATFYRTRNVHFESHAAGWQMYLGEGIKYTVHAPNGKTLHASMVSESTIGAANTGVNYHVGEETPGMPEGTWVVEFQLFLGHPYITAHYVGPMALGA